MTVFRSTLRAASFLIALAPLAEAQTTAEVSLSDGRVIARQALLAGNPALARDFALALLDANPDDRAALVILAAAQTQLGNAEAGRRAGARAFRLSTTDGERYEAARLTALAAANEEKFTLTQFWLRRAAAHAPTEAALAQTRSDFRGIRRMNPWNVGARLSFSPSNNVNGGSEVSYNLIDGLPFVGILSGDAQALPGVSGSVDLTFSRRIDAGATHRTTFAGRVNTRRVWLGSEANDIAPDTVNSDLGSTYLELGIDHRRQFLDGQLIAKVDLGGSWFGGDFNYPFARATLGYGQQLGDRGTLTGEVAFEQQFTAQETDPANSILSVSTGYRWRTENGATWSLALDWAETRSININSANETTTARASYRLADKLGPATVTFSFGATYADYPRYAGLGVLPGGGIGLVSVGREDTKVFGAIEAAFYEWDYAGFAPVVTLTAEDTESNVSRYRRNSVAINLGIRSTF